MEYSIFGCRLNKYYLNQWLNYFASHAFADRAFLITTCEVTDRAKQKWIKLAKKKLADGHHLYLTGCGTLKRGAVISSELFYELYPDLRPFSNSITLLGESPSQSSRTKCGDPDVDCFASDSQGLQEGKNIFTKKFVVIQNGCDNYCSFCLTVQKRGKHVSRSREDIVQDINEFAQSGGKEIVLTGVNIAAWGCSNSTKANESKFVDLLQYILDNTTIPRIRLSSLGPEYLNDAFFKVIQDTRILPHFHLSIQSFSDGVLQGMRRNYMSKDLTRVLTKFRALKKSVPVSLGADIIIGFPGETEYDFQQTLDGIETFKINKVHSFPFSDHHIGEKIPASLLPNQVDAVTKKRREKNIKKIADKLTKEFYQLNVGTKHWVLVEGKGSGRTENYIKVSVGLNHKRGEIVGVVT